MSQLPTSKKKIKNYLLYTIVLVVGAIVVYFVMSSDQPTGVDDSGINTEVPEPENAELPDKNKAYVEDELNSLSLGSFDVGDEDGELDLMGRKDSAPSKEEEAAIAMERARQAQQEALKTASSVSGMVANPEATHKHHDELEQALKKQDELERQIREKDAELRIAQSKKEFNAILSEDAVLQAANSQHSEADNSVNTNVVSPVPKSQGDVATTLGRSSGRTGGFYGMGNVDVQRNSIKACAYGEQVVGDGQHLRIRLLEPMMVSGQLIPAGSVLTGTCRIMTDRLQVSILSIEYGGVITRVALEVYDNDGQQGLYVPGSMEMEAGREIGADIASSVGSTAASQTSMFSQQSAAEQIKADVGRGVVQGTFRFIGRKLQVIKVTVQDKHLLFLMSQK
jgi:conjugative transposon TraM protein